MASSLGASMLRQTRLTTFPNRLLPSQTPARKAFTVLYHQQSIYCSNRPRAKAHEKEPCAKSPIALFHHSSRKDILTPKPQVIHGTINDPVPIREPNPTHGSYHWTFERLVSIGLIPLTVAPFAAGSLNPTLDAVLCAALLVHSHMGFQSIIIDYLPSKRVPKSRAVAWWGLRAATILVGAGLYEFETNDVGITQGIKRIWKA